jgi:hypothetical protein
MLDYIFKTIKEYSYPPVAMTVSVIYDDKFRYSVLTTVENPDIGHCPYTLRYATKPKGYMSLSTKIL